MFYLNFINLVPEISYHPTLTRYHGKMRENEFPRRLCEPLRQYDFIMSAVTPHY